MAEETATAEEAVETEPTAEPDPLREAAVERLTSAIGSALLESHIDSGRDLTIRVDRSAWIETFRYARREMGLNWLDFLSAIDWLPSPFGRDMEAEQDWIVHGRDEKETPAMQTGVAGGDTRFQVFARTMNISNGLGLTVKADLPDEDLSIDTLLTVFPGVNWHEREAWEMFGITFTGHPDLRALYLPTGFEGNPMRKDFPLLSRRVKPWPGIVDVEPMPGNDDDEGAGND